MMSVKEWFIHTTLTQKTEFYASDCKVKTKIYIIAYFVKRIFPLAMDLLITPVCRWEYSMSITSVCNVLEEIKTKRLNTIKYIMETPVEDIIKKVNTDKLDVFNVIEATKEARTEFGLKAQELITELSLILHKSKN